MSTENFQQPLSLHFIWHSGNNTEVSEYLEFFNNLFQKTNNTPSAHAINIPAYFHTNHNGSIPKIEAYTSKVQIYYVFISKHIVVDDIWIKFLLDLNATQTNLILLSLDQYAYNLPKSLSGINYIRAHEFKKEYSKQNFVIAISHEIYRIALNPRYSEIALGRDSAITLFLSHTKDGKQGEEIAKQLKTFLDQTALKMFFDTTYIAPGYAFKKEIEGHINSSTIIAIHSDQYSSRFWCQEEIRLAKLLNRPIIAVDSLSENEDRRYPYSSNIPSVHVHLGNDGVLNENDILRILISGLLETLRYFHSGLLITQQKPDACKWFLMRPPEYSDLSKLIEVSGTTISHKSTLVLYPDPPVYAEEIEELQKFGIQFKTPIEIYSDKRLHKIGISISEVSSEELIENGQNQNHLQQLSQYLAWYLLGTNNKLYYGGDLRPGGFTEILLEEAKIIQARMGMEEILISNYLAWPLYLSNGIDFLDFQAKYTKVASFVKCDLPTDVIQLVNDASKYLPPNTTESQFIWSRSLTEMRKRSIGESDVRIFAGGRYSGYKGKMAGVLEEFLLAINQGKHIFVIGGFGGISNAIGEWLLSGVRTTKLNLEWQKLNNPGYSDMLNYAETQGHNYATEYADRNDIRISNLRNGLTYEENLELIKTPFKESAIRLIFKGLKNLPTSI